MKAQIVLAISVLLFLTSCYHKTFTLNIKNSTKYEIDSIRFGCSNIDTTISIAANGNNMMSVEAKMFFPVAEPVLCYTIQNYSYMQTSYNNSIGRMFALKHLKKNEVNNIRIKIDKEATDSLNIFELYPE